MLEKYGVINPGQIPEVKQKIRKLLKNITHLIHQNLKISFMINYVVNLMMLEDSLGVNYIL